MTLDLVILGLVVFFAIWGAFTGAARQIAQYVALVVAGLAAGPCGEFFGDPVALKLATSLTIGVVIATVFSFILLFFVVRLIVSLLLKRLIRGEKHENSGRDRILGFFLGGLRMALFAYLALCAMAFVENNVKIAGRQLGFAPKDSVAFSVVRKFNVLEQQQFGGSDDLLKVAKVVTSPQEASRLLKDSDFTALTSDPRFKKLMSSEALKKALQTGDVRKLLESNAAVELLQDDKMMRHIDRLNELERK